MTEEDKIFTASRTGTYLFSPWGDEIPFLRFLKEGESIKNNLKSCHYFSEENCEENPN